MKKKGDFGVWKLWEELKKIFPSFEFEHGHGLGVLPVGKNCPTPLKEFILTDSPDKIREFYFSIGEKLDILLAEKNLIAQLTEYEQKEKIFNGRLSELNKTVENLSSQAAKRDQTIQALSNQIEAQALAHATLKDEMTEKIQTIQSLTNRVEEAERNSQNLLNEITLITNSKSWRITRPIRKLMKKFRK